MANITRIKAKNEESPEETGDEKVLAKREKTKKVVAKKVDKKAVKAKKIDKKDAKPKKERKIFAPFRYIRNSWREIRQVRWPDRKTTWKMTLSVIVYVIIFGTVIMLLDVFFTFIFNLILGE